MILSEIRNKLKKSNFIYSTYTSITDHNYRSGYAAYFMHRSAKPWSRIREELSILREYWRCDPIYYFRYRLYEKNLTRDELLDYVPPYYFYNFYMPCLYDDPSLPRIDSKISLNEYFISKGIRTAKTVAIIQGGKIRDRNEKLGFEDLKKILTSSESNRFFVKPDTGRGGRGIFMIEKNERGLFINRDPFTPGLFSEMTKNSDYVIQEALEQRKDINEIYQGSVNTLRVITQYMGNKPGISAVVMRMGRRGAFVDNSTNGGISTGIDPATGAFLNYAFTEHTTERFDSHPETGFRFEGSVISGWPEIVSTITEFSKKAPEFPDVAWDIAILENGIAAIEINLNYGLDHLQCTLGGVRKKLNIKPLIYYSINR